MAESTEETYQRPKFEQIQSFAPTPQYIQHTYQDDMLAILVCQIKIWQPKGVDWFNIPGVDSCLTIRECESIEVTDSAKELINKAVVKFPRGTVIKISSNYKKNVKTGTKEDKTRTEQTLDEASNAGEVITPDSANYSTDNISTTSMAARYDDKGLIDFNRSKTEDALLSPNDVAIGQRIEIRLGYAYSEAEYKMMNGSDGKNMDLVFTGFITSISVDTPLELECTNMAHVLTTVSAPNINLKDSVQIKDLLDSGGKYDLLKDTGISLHPSSVGSQINVKGGSMTNNVTIADVLNAWNKSGVLSIMELQQDGSCSLRVGLTYYAGKGGGALPNGDKKYITYNGGNNSVAIIHFDWDVSNDKLSLMRNDKKYLAIEAQGRVSKDKVIKFTIIKNPDNDDEGWMDTGNTNTYEGQFRQVNKRQGKKKSQLKYYNGTFSEVKADAHMEDKVNLSKYNVIPYISTKIGITEQELVEEAKQYWARYVPNGISGSLTIFGDIFVKPTDVVGLIDKSHPEKNGYYYVESVHTTFGVNGYRRELKMPYKVASFAEKIKYI